MAPIVALDRLLPTRPARVSHRAAALSKIRNSLVTNRRHAFEIRVHQSTNSGISSSDFN